MEAFSKAIVGKRIRRIREYKGLSRVKFASLVDISPQFIAEIENGQKCPSMETLYKICKACEISADYIVFGQNPFGSDNLITKMFNQVPDHKRSEFEDMMRTVSNMLIAEGSRPSDS